MQCYMAGRRLYWTSLKGFAFAPVGNGGASGQPVTVFSWRELEGRLSLAAMRVKIHAQTDVVWLEIRARV